MRLCLFPITPLPFLCTFGVPSLQLFSICSTSLTFSPSTGVSKHFWGECKIFWSVAYLHYSCKNSITPRNSPEDGQTEASSSKVPVIVNCKPITLSVTDWMIAAFHGLTQHFMSLPRQNKLLVACAHNYNLPQEWWKFFAMGIKMCRLYALPSYLVLYRLQMCSLHWTE